MNEEPWINLLWNNEHKKMIMKFSKTMLKKLIIFLYNSNSNSNSNYLTNRETIKLCKDYSAHKGLEFDIENIKTSLQNYSIEHE